MTLLPSAFRWTEHRLIIEGLNDGDVLPAVLSGESFLGAVPNNLLPTVMLRGTVGGNPLKYRQGFNPPAGRVAEIGPTTTLESYFRYKPYITNPVNPVVNDAHGADGVPAVVGSLSSSLLIANGGQGYGRATSIMAWVRKLNGGDTINQRFTIGFHNATTAGSFQNSIARVGLIGNNAGGFMFASVNCPDGPGNHTETFADVNANSVQPTDINSTGTNWFHARIKLIPRQYGTSTAPKVECYLNGTLAATFTDTVQNFPRGALGTNQHYEAIQAGINYQPDSVVVLPSVLLSDVRVWIEGTQ